MITSTAASVSLVVLCATVPDGFPADPAFAFRDLISASKPVYFQYLNPSAFLVYFTDSVSGKAQADALELALRNHACNTSIAPLGVAVSVAQCLAHFDAQGRIDLPPIGSAINDAMAAARQDALSIVKAL
jgi:hypothetical protein